MPDVRQVSSPLARLGRDAARALGLRADRTRSDRVRKEQSLTYDRRKGYSTHMHEVVDRLTAALRSWAKRDATYAVVVNAPCPAANIAALETRAGWQLPEPYRRFLEAANGVRVHDQVESVLMDLLPAEDLPIPVDDHQRETLAEEDGLELSDVFIIGRVFMHNLYVFLDKKTGETVKWVQFESSRYPAFDAYLDAEAKEIASVP